MDTLSPWPLTLFSLSLPFISPYLSLSPSLPGDSETVVTFDNEKGVTSGPTPVEIQPLEIGEVPTGPSGYGT